VGTIADMSVAENVVSERYRKPPSAGAASSTGARRGASPKRLIADYDVKCPSPDTRIRLLSGGNMQKLILGRALDPDPIIILANQPTRGLDVGAVAYVHGKLLEARDRGAAILLISEDLDEVLALSDAVIVAYQGEVSAPSARGERTVAELGELMAGHGIGEAA
jgi:general nucleoside transport system ATP-binding protein